MGIDSSAAIATGSLADLSALSLADPHLAVLAVLVGFWAVDKLLGAIERLRQGRVEAAGGPPPTPVASDGRQP